MCLNAVVFAVAGRSVAFESLEKRRLLSSYYVDVTGSDSNPGTLELPFRTIQPAATRAGAGDTIFVHPGEYPGFIMGWDYPQNGTPDAPITFKADPGAVVTTRNNKTNDIINLEGTNYVILDGFTITPTAEAG